MNDINRNTAKQVTMALLPMRRTLFGIPVIRETLSVRFDGSRVMFSVITRFPMDWGELIGYGMNREGGNILYWNYELEVHFRTLHGQLIFQER